ncbi:MAG TPA: lasso peptide biosynthesis B2 protein [Acidobacteriota bacterium]
MRRWRAFMGLSGLERRWLVQALFLLPLTAWAIRWVGLRRLQSLLEGVTPSRFFPGAGLDRPTDWTRRAARMVEIAAARGPYCATCLHRSVVLWCLLRRHGVDSELRIGIRKQAGGLDAHAWVEHAGVALNERPPVAERYRPFRLAFPAPKPNRS